MKHFAQSLGRLVWAPIMFKQYGITSGYGTDLVKKIYMYSVFFKPKYCKQLW